MNRNILFIMIFLNSTLSYGQIENRWQPDSVYYNKKVKKIYVYQNSPKDLSEILEFDRNGKIIRVEKYTASYNRRSRRNKHIGIVTYHHYDTSGNLTQTTDSTYHLNGTFGIDKKIYDYKDNLLVSSKYYKRKFEIPYSETIYHYNPFKSTTVIKDDTLIIYKKTSEYDKEFYLKRTYGFVLEPKLKEGKGIINGDAISFSYADKNDREKFQSHKTIQNIFNEKGQIVEAKVKSVFRNDRVNEYTLQFKYYKNGLTKSVSGYIATYYKYEY